MNTRAVAAQNIKSGSQVPVQKPTTLENVHKWLKLMGEIVTAIVIVATFASVILGTIIIRIYLSHFIVVISPLDTFGASSLEIFMVFFITLLGSAGFLFLAPLLATYLVGRETRASLPNLFGRSYIPPDTQRFKNVAVSQPRPPLLLTRGTFLQFLLEYTAFYFPTLCLIWIIPIDMYLEIPAQQILPWTILFSVIISAFSLYIFRLKGRPHKFLVYYSVMQINWAAGLWVLLLEINMFRAWEHGVAQSVTPGEHVLIEASVVSFVAMLCHVFMAWPKLPIRGVVALTILIGLGFYLYPGYGEIGAEALREAQLGGGTPISYTVKGSPPTTPPNSGCLVLATTSYVLIGEIHDNKCPRLTRFAFNAPEVKPRPVRWISRNEINIREVPGE
jgi:hypothetical protein